MKSLYSKPLFEICPVKYGKGLSKKERKVGNIPVMGSNGQIDWHNIGITKTPCIVIGRKGSIGQIHYVRSSCWPIDTSYYLDEWNGRVDPEFLFFFLHTVGLNFKNKAGAIPSLLRPDLETVKVPLPAPEEQYRIVARIKECLERVEEIETLSGQNAADCDSLLESIIEAEFQNVSGNPAVLRDVCKISSKLVDPLQSNYLDLFHVGGANIESKTGKLIDLKTVREEELKSAKFVFDETMVLYNKIRPYLMKVARPDFPGLCSADMYPLSPNPERLTRDYLFYLLLSRRFTKYAIEGSSRAGMPKVNRTYLFEFEFLLPPIEVQVDITKVIDSAFLAFDELRLHANNKKREVDFLREAILRKAFAGGI